MGAGRPSRRTGHRRPVKGQRNRCPTGKTRYREQFDAAAAARIRTESTGVDLYVYECGQCKGWHRTSMSPGAYAEARGIEYEVYRPGH